MKDSGKFASDWLSSSDEAAGQESGGVMNEEVITAETPGTDNSRALSSEEEYRAIVEKFIALIETPGKDGKIDIDEFYTRLGELYSPCCKVYLNGSEKAQNSEEVIRDLVTMVCTEGLRFKVFRHKLLFPGCFEFHLRFSTNDYDFKIVGRADFEDVKIYKLIETRVKEQRTPGLIAATDASADTERTGLGLHVFELPSEVNRQVLGMHANMMPTTNKYDMLRIIMSYKKIYDKWIDAMLMFWREDFEILLTDTNGHKYARGARFHCLKRAIRSNKMALLDFENQPVALCEENGYGFVIYGTRRMRDDDGDGFLNEPKTELVGRGRQVGVFYPWFRVESKIVSSGRIYFVSAFSSDLSSIKVGYDPVYKIETSQESPGKRVAKVTDSDFSANQYASIRTDENHKEGKWVQVDVAPGVDPALILCLAVCIEEQESS